MLDLKKVLHQLSDFTLVSTLPLNIINLCVSSLIVWEQSCKSSTGLDDSPCSEERTQYMSGKPGEAAELLCVRQNDQ